jgi:E3 ubiquitin-protein ligase RNF128
MWVTILMPKDCGTDLQNALNNGTEVWMSIQAGRPYTVYYTGINRTSVFFVSISFIVLTIASLAWLVFYYVQRMRHAYAKERFSVS